MALWTIKTNVKDGEITEYVLQDNVITGFEKKEQAGTYGIGCYDKPYLTMFCRANGSEGFLDKSLSIKDAGCVIYSWNRLLQNREVQKYSWIYLEDFDSLLNEKTESALALVFELFKRSRPYGGIVTLIAQSVEELKKTETGNACFVSAGFIRCMSCKCQDRKTISKVFGLHDDILEYISSAPVGSGLLIAPELVIPFVGN